MICDTIRYWRGKIRQKSKIVGIHRLVDSTMFISEKVADLEMLHKGWQNPEDTTVILMIEQSNTGVTCDCRGEGGGAVTAM